MIIAILNFISALFSGAGKLFEWLYARQMVDAGKVQGKLDELSAQVRNAQIAVAAREAIRAVAASNPDSVSDDDGFRRD